MARVLVLAGTTDASELAARLAGAGIDVVSSLAGITRGPRPRPGRVRTGGFGGVRGLARYLTEEGIDALVDATHPFAAVMPFHAAEAARLAGVPHLRLLRPAWEASAGDRWHHVPTLASAAQALEPLAARRVFLAVGRQSAAAFARCIGVRFVVRAIEPLDGALPGATVVIDRGPYRLEDERQLLIAHRIDTLVTKNSGGTATAAKLQAATELAVRVVMIDRPPQPDVPMVPGVLEAERWLASLGFTA
jgi:precorrin-6A/cobalt-precorrin-6A reductase